MKNMVKVKKGGQKKHHHGGKSTESLINAKKVLQQIEINQNFSILDLGCGSGYFSIQAAKNFINETGIIYAIDIHEESINKLKNKFSKMELSNIKPIIADVTEGLPVEEKSIDFCIIANVLHGFVVNGETEMVLDNLEHVLKKNALVAVIEFKKSKLVPGPPIDERLSRFDAMKLMTLRPFKFIKNIKVGLLHYGLLFKVIK